MRSFMQWRRSRSYAIYRTFYRADPRPIPARGTRRRLVVTISALMVASFVLTALVHGIFALLALWVVGPAYLWFAWQATRNMTAVDPVYLDERQRAQIMEANHIAFRIIAATFLFPAGVLISLNTFVLHISQVDVDRVTMLVFLAGVLLIPWIPVAVLGWRLPDEQPEDEPVGSGPVS